MMIRLKVETVNGIIVAHRELLRPTPLTTRYNGIRPPPKNMVKVIMIIRYLFQNTFFRDKT
ncbi:hypothetical protein D3C71_1733180 [compost metagenome]